MQPDYENLRHRIEGCINEKVLYSGEVSNIIYNLGGRQSRETVQIHLNSRRIRVQGLDITLGLFGFYFDPHVYTAQTVWEYLISLETERKIRLKERGVSKFEDIINRALQRKELVHAGSGGRRIRIKRN